MFCTGHSSTESMRVYEDFPASSASPCLLDCSFLKADFLKSPGDWTLLRDSGWSITDLYLELIFDRIFVVLRLGDFYEVLGN